MILIRKAKIGEFRNMWHATCDECVPVGSWQFWFFGATLGYALEHLRREHRSSAQGQPTGCRNATLDTTAREEAAAASTGLLTGFAEKIGMSLRTWQVDALKKIRPLD